MNEAGVKQIERRILEVEREGGNAEKILRDNKITKGDLLLIHPVEHFTSEYSLVNEVDWDEELPIKYWVREGLDFEKISQRGIQFDSFGNIVELHGGYLISREKGYNERDKEMKEAGL